MKQTACKKCGSLIKNCNLKRHVGACDGSIISKTKPDTCKYCNLLFSGLSDSLRANHIRWCKLNPKQEKYRLQLNRVRSCCTEDTTEKQRESTTNLHKIGFYVNAQNIQRLNPSFKGRHHTEKTKTSMRDIALLSTRRRLRKNTQIYNGILMDSMWEVILAKRLDSLNVKWIRPDPLVWFDDQTLTHHYFPDFYLTDYDIYLDPKNPFAYKVQETKIKILQKTYTNIIFLTSLEEINNYDPTIGKELKISG